MSLQFNFPELRQWSAVEISHIQPLLCRKIRLTHRKLHADLLNTIINADDFGITYSTNQAIEQLYQNKFGTISWKSFKQRIESDNRRQIRLIDDMFGFSYALSYEKRELEHRLFNDPEIKERIEHQSIRLISWKEIREWQRRDSVPHEP
jgi:hypothetical protein